MDTVSPSTPTTPTNSLWTNDPQISGFFAAGMLELPRPPHWREHGLIPLPFEYLKELSKVYAKAEMKIVRNLDWLQTNHFVQINGFTDNSSIFCQIYLIPEDYGDLKEQWRTVLFSRHSLLSKATKRLRNLLVHVSRCWLASEDAIQEDCQTMFLDETELHRSLGEIYQQLPSPSPNAALEDAPVYQPAGLLTELMRFQRRSVARMMEMESRNPDPQPSPLWISIRSLDDMTNPRSFFIDPSRLLVRTSQPSYVPIRGGILCEEMGTGKTVMCLALVLSSLDYLSRPSDGHSTLTSWHAETFGDPSEPRASSVPSLANLACHVLRTSMASPSWERYTRTAPLAMQRQLRDPIFVPYTFADVGTLSIDERTRSELKPSQLGDKIYVTHATLLLVPKMILPQWRAEIRKHTAGALRVHIIDESRVILSVETLANDYDLVVMSHEKLKTESNRKAKDGLKRFALTKIHWLRVIVDEGNICSSASETMKSARRISTERRWIVSGTPTPHLISAQDYMGDLDLRRVDSYKLDMQKLAIMITAFLHQRVSPMVGGFHELLQGPTNEEKLFNSLLSTPFCSSSRDEHWLISIVVDRLLRQLMVRHTIDDVEKDVVLPPLTRNAIILQMDPWQAITYNVMQSVIAINAIDSERTDQDYFFHLQNQASLLTLVQNLRQTCFWRMEDSAYSEERLREMLANSSNALKKTLSTEDLELVLRAREAQNAAYTNGTWRSMMQQTSAPLRVYHLPDALREVWDVLEPQSDPSSPGSPKPDSLRRASPVFMHNIPHLQDAGSLCDLALEDMIASGEKYCNRRAVYENAKSKVNQKALERGKLSKSDVAKLSHANTLKPTVHNLEIAGLVQPAVPHINPLLHVRMGPSTSPKINFVISELMRNPKDRFIIFSEAPLYLEYLQGSLDTVKINTKLLSAAAPETQRLECIREFEQVGNGYRALLLELKHGARGLNLTSANRIIFLEPIWRLDIESQAVKRAHRLGQTKPVTVQTLAMKGTAEDEMLRRRDEGNREEKTMQNDSVMRNFIANPKFVEVTDNVDPRTLFDVPVFTLDIPIADFAPPTERGPQAESGTRPLLIKTTKRSMSAEEVMERPKKRVAFE